MHIFAHDNTLSAWGKAISKLVDNLESESNITIDWFTKNKMIINRDKFQAIVLDSKKSNLKNIHWLLTIKLSSQFHQLSSELFWTLLVPSAEFFWMTSQTLILTLEKISRTAANQLNI